MLSKKGLFKTKEYWIEELQNEIYRQVTEYMSKHDLNQNELAEKWGVSKGYVSQILKGDCNFSLKKLVELSLAMEKAPIVQYVETDIYYDFVTLSKYMEKRINKPFEISYTRNKTFVRNEQPFYLPIISNRSTVIKNDEPIAA